MRIAAELIATGRASHGWAHRWTATSLRGVPGSSTWHPVAPPRRPGSLPARWWPRSKTKSSKAATPWSPRCSPGHPAPRWPWSLPTLRVIAGPLRLISAPTRVDSRRGNEHKRRLEASWLPARSKPDRNRSANSEPQLNTRPKADVGGGSGAQPWVLSQKKAPPTSSRGRRNLKRLRRCCRGCTWKTRPPCDR